MTHSITCPSPVGVLTLAGDGERLSGLWIAGQRYHGAVSPAPPAPLPIFEEAQIWLKRYFAGEKPAISDLPLAPVGSSFRQAVWSLLCEIPYGQTSTYGEIARRLATAPRAVGAAIGRNPISIIIPCHRVVGADGSLTGYAGGLDVKRRLLQLENQELLG